MSKQPGGTAVRVDATAGLLLGVALGCGVGVGVALGTKVGVAKGKGRLDLGEASGGTLAGSEARIPRQPVKDATMTSSGNFLANRRPY
jgi:hypothetical protein